MYLRFVSHRDIITSQNKYIISETKIREKTCVCNLTVKLRKSTK